MAMINVDPEQVDQFYRYKMPRVFTKIEGNGNGIKTVVPNIKEIAESLSRDVECMMKYFAHELAVTTKFKDEKWIMTGSFQQDTVQTCIFTFIKKFVLCKDCGNPETVLQLDERKDIWLNCKACSHVTPVDPKEKICNILKRSIETAAGEACSKSDKVKKDKSRTLAAPKTKVEKQEEKFQRETRQAKNEDIISEELKEELPNPVEVLKNYISGKGEEAPPTETDVINKVFDLKNDYGLNDKTVVALVFETLFDVNIIKQLEPQKRLFVRFLKPDTEVEVIINVMLLCMDESSLKPKFAIILKKCYDLGVISEKCITEWYDSPYKKSANGGVDKDSVQFFKEKAKPFVEWLREDEEEEEDGQIEQIDSSPTAEAAASVKTNGTVLQNHDAPPLSSSKEKDHEEINIDEI